VQLCVGNILLHSLDHILLLIFLLKYRAQYTLPTYIQLYKLFQNIFPNGNSFMEASSAHFEMGIYQIYQLIFDMSIISFSFKSFKFF